MDLKSIREECSGTIRAGDKCFSIPLSVGFFVVLLHNFSVLGRRKLSSFQSIYLPVEFLWGLRTWPALLFRQLALLNFPLLLTCFDVDLQTMCAILAATDVACARYRPCNPLFTRIFEEYFHLTSEN